MLNSHGIPTALRDEYLATVYLPYAQALGGVGLCVNSEDVEQARALLEDTAEVSKAERKKEEEFPCPRCGTHDWQKIGPPFFQMLLMMLIAVPIAERYTTHRCRKCGNEIRI